MNLEKIFKSALNIFSKNSLTVILGFLVMAIVSFFTLGILAPAVGTGYQIMLLKAKRGKKIEINDIFSALNKFWTLWGLALLIGLICLLLSVTIIGIIPMVFMLTWWMYANILIVDKNLSVSKAMKMSKDLVRKNNIWMHLLLLILINIISSLGSYIMFVGILITAPIAAAVLVSAYDEEKIGKTKAKK